MKKFCPGFKFCAEKRGTDLSVGVVASDKLIRDLTLAGWVVQLWPMGLLLSYSWANGVQIITGCFVLNRSGLLRKGNKYLVQKTVYLSREKKERCLSRSTTREKKLRLLDWDLSMTWFVDQFADQ